MANEGNANPGVEVRDRFEVLAVETDMDWKITSAIEFNVVGVQKPLASAARKSRAGTGSCSTKTAHSLRTRERARGMEVRVKDGTFVFEVELTNGGLGG